MNFPKTLLLASLCTGTSQLYAACYYVSPTVDFGLGGEDLIINNMSGSNARHTAHDAVPNPQRYPIVFKNCSRTSERTSNSYLELTNKSSLDTNDTLLLPTLSGQRTFFAIKGSNYGTKPAGAEEPKVYMSFAVYDPKHPEYITELQKPNYKYQILKQHAPTDSLGLVLDKVYIYILTNKNTVPGVYQLNNIAIGEMSTKTFRADGVTVHEQSTSSALIRIAPSLKFQIKQSTCVLSEKNYAVKLDVVLAREFQSINQIIKTKDLNISMTCPDENPGTQFNAMLTDNSPLATSNNQGLLKNTIPVSEGGSNVEVILLDSSQQPMLISGKTQQQVFEFGTLDNSKKIVYPIKVGYHATQLPVTPGNVKAIANINVNYN